MNSEYERRNDSVLKKTEHAAGLALLTARGSDGIPTLLGEVGFSRMLD